MAKITEKSRKDEIWEELKKVREELKEKEENRKTPKEVKKEKVEKEVVKKVETFQPEKVLNMVEKFQKQMEDINSELKVFNDIKFAVDIKKKEIDELYKLSNESENLHALVLMQDELKKKTEEEVKQLKDDANLYYEKIKIDADNYRKSVISEIKETEKKAQEDAKRKKEEFEYDFSREVLIQNNKLEDSLEQKTKEFEAIRQEQIDMIEARKKEVKEKEKEIESILKENETLKANIIEKVELAEKESKEKAKKSYEYEVRYLKKDYESKIELMENKIENALLTITKLDGEKFALETKLDEAYKRIQDLASKTVEGTKSNSVLNQVQSMLDKKDK